jgi:hypothetical protein
MLVGTIAKETAQGTADGIGVFFDQAVRSVVRLKTGEDHKGWVLRAVQRREVVLEKGRQTAVLTLPPPELNKAGPVPPVPTLSRSSRTSPEPDKSMPPPPITPVPASASKLRESEKSAPPRSDPAKAGTANVSSSSPAPTPATASPANLSPPMFATGNLFPPPQIKPAPAQVNPFQQQPVGFPLPAAVGRGTPTLTR